MGKFAWVIAGLLVSNPLWAAEIEKTEKADEEKVVEQDKVEDEELGLKHRVVELEALVSILQSQVAAIQGQAHSRYTAGEAVADTTAARTAAIASHTANTNAHHVAIADPDPTGVLTKFSRNGDDIFLDSANLHVVNGLSHTATTNGLGNVIIGYNEPDQPSTRTGSHMLVVGTRLNYSSYGGIIAGSLNTTSGAFASITGGVGNTARGDYASVAGGEMNEANGRNSSVVGGRFNRAFGESAAVLGGRDNVAMGQDSAVSGGHQNVANEFVSSVSGGQQNAASGVGSSVSGGAVNEATGLNASVSGGANNVAVRGAVSGGANNTAIGGASSISGGRFNSAVENYSHPDTHTP